MYIASCVWWIMELHKGGLDVQKVFNTWYCKYNTKNYGAFISFVGIIRSEDDISGLSFDIYEPLLKKWFDKWVDKLKEENVAVCFAHSLGDVEINQSSFCCAIISKQRKSALKYIDVFVEDFKQNAPIWKYDIVDKKRIYTKSRSKKIKGSGILS